MPIFRFSANRDAWWQWYLVHLLSFASSSTSLSNVAVLLSQRNALFLVFLQDGPILLLSLLSPLVTDHSADTFRRRLCTVFKSIFCDDHALCDPIGRLRCDELFSLWAFLVKKIR